MTPHPEQLWLLPTVPRLLEPGEPCRCLDCGVADAFGTYGPPGLESVQLREPDGRYVEHTVRLEDQWLCGEHAGQRWAEWRRCQTVVAARRRWLAAHRHVEALGVKAARERFPMVAALLADPTWQPDSDGSRAQAEVPVSYGKNHPEAVIGRDAPAAEVTATAPCHSAITSGGRSGTSTDGDGWRPEGVAA